MRPHLLLAAPLLLLAQGAVRDDLPGASVDAAVEVEGAEPAPVDPALVARVATALAEDRTLAGGLARLERWSQEGDLGAARLLGEALLAPDPLSSWRARVAAGDSAAGRAALETLEPAIDWLGLGGRTREQRAHVRFGLGVIEARAGERTRAAMAFEAARAEAGPGSLRRDAVYDLAWLELAEGEAWRSRIPELGGGAPPQPATGGADGEEPPDPLEEARRHYLAAREHLIEALRLEPTAADARGNSELCLRRLRELDELERQRQQQEQQEQQDEQQEPEDQQEDQQEDESQQDESQQDQEQQQEPEDSEPQEPEESEPEDPQQDEAERDEDQQQDQQDDTEQAPEPREERYLTREEVQRLLDRLEEHERQGEELRERMQQARRRPSPRDW